MKRLTINRARTLGKDMNAKGVVILAFGDDGEFQAASYGRTKQDCGQLGKWLDGIYDAVESGEIAPPFTEQQSPERLTGLGEREPVSSEDWIPAGSALPYVQVGMVIRRSAGGPRLVIEDIYDPRYPMALCRSGVGKEVRILCAELRENYRLLESFSSICRRRHGPEVVHACE